MMSFWILSLFFLLISVNPFSILWNEHITTLTINNLCLRKIHVSYYFGLCQMFLLLFVCPQWVEGHAHCSHLYWVSLKEAESKPYVRISVYIVNWNCKSFDNSIIGRVNCEKLWTCFSVATRNYPSRLLELCGYSHAQRHIFDFSDLMSLIYRYPADCIFNRSTS
jgi:hypothetical protein